MIDGDVEDVGEDAHGTLLGGDETPDAADPKSINRVRRKRKLVEDNRANFLRRMMAEPEGRLFVWDLLSDLGTFDIKFGMTPGGMSNDRESWFYQGQNHFGQRLYRTLMKADHAAMYQMHKEHDPAFAEPKKPKMRTAT